MKNYDVTLTAHYEKTVSVCADSPEQAAEKVKIILFDTDLIEFSDEDFVCGEADITEHSEDGLDDTDEEELSEEDDCSDCPYFCPVCGKCLYEDECEDMSYQALNLANQIPLVRGLPLIPRENRKEFENE